MSVLSNASNLAFTGVALFGQMVSVQLEVLSRLLGFGGTTVKVLKHFSGFNRKRLSIS
jgi:hypothetical protein